MLLIKNSIHDLFKCFNFVLKKITVMIMNPGAFIAIISPAWHVNYVKMPLLVEMSHDLIYSHRGLLGRWHSPKL